MGIVPVLHRYLVPNSVMDDCANSCHEAVQKTVEDHFELIDTAGMGFFGIVFYALSKSDFLHEQSLLTNDLKSLHL